MSLVAARKCVRHVAREAVARCRSCTDHFCRECVVEHEGELLCAPCLAKVAAERPAGKAVRWQAVGRVALTLASIGLLWIVFYGFGQFLKLIPPKVHEGTVWQPDQS